MNEWVNEWMKYSFPRWQAGGNIQKELVPNFFSCHCVTWVIQCIVCFLPSNPKGDASGGNLNSCRSEDEGHSWAGLYLLHLAKTAGDSWRKCWPCFHGTWVWTLPLRCNRVNHFPFVSFHFLADSGRMKGATVCGSPLQMTRRHENFDLRCTSSKAALHKRVMWGALSTAWVTRFTPRPPFLATWLGSSLLVSSVAIFPCFHTRHPTVPSALAIWSLAWGCLRDLWAYHWECSSCGPPPVSLSVLSSALLLLFAKLHMPSET